MMRLNLLIQANTDTPSVVTTGLLAVCIWCADKLYNVVEVAAKDVMSTSSVVTIGLISQKLQKYRPDMRYVKLWFSK
jgi:hypothetical protein